MPFAGLRRRVSCWYNRAMETSSWRAWARLVLVTARSQHAVRGSRRWMERLMTDSPQAPAPADEASDKQAAPPLRVVTLYLVRHGQTQYNVEQRLPGQLPGIPLTDEGVRQAEQLNDALRELPLSAVVTSPLERALQTATIVMRGRNVPLRLDSRLMDLDVGRWAGQLIGDLNKSDPDWGRFSRRPTEPPLGIEGFYELLSRVVAAAEEARREEALGNYVMMVAHADVVKVLIAHYLRLPVEGIGWMHIGNASVTALTFAGDHTPALQALNWTPSPAWLRPTPPAPTTDALTTHAPAGGTPTSAGETSAPIEPGADHAAPAAISDSDAALAADDPIPVHASDADAEPIVASDNNTATPDARTAASAETSGE